ncbi:expressed unknown protein [Seminavis robusta]|uniref:Uncharacterized protein n=1 Tax=Seminavis robusta TaxID=568900 RepID=A0A9N8DG06_9STRA|nr:expressed unknown protein [Seminavis robusta]|eukprot:Sro139_g065220.1 n/a (243) ;mRNA; r:95138-95866
MNKDSSMTVLADAARKRKRCRTNWAVGAAKDQLQDAIQEWDAQTGRALSAEGKRLPLKDYAALVGIPYHTFRKYASGARSVGNSTGRQPLLDKAEQAWIARQLANKGDGLLAHEAVDFVRQRHPELSRAQALRHFHRTLLKHHPQQLKVPPKRQYQKRQQRQQQQDCHVPEEEEDEEDEEEEDSEEEEEEEEMEQDDIPPPFQQQRQSKKLRLEALDARIAKLRSDLLDAELEKERLLREED